MGDLFEDCAALASDTADPKEILKLQNALVRKPWKGVYALPVEGTQNEDSSAVYRCVADPSNPTKTQLAAQAIPQYPDIKSAYQLLRFSAKVFGRKAYLGERPPIRDSNGKKIGLCGFQFFTFADTLRVVEALGRALDLEVQVPLSVYEKEGDDKPSCEPLRVLGVWSRSRMDWRLIDFAASYRGIVTVPLYDTLGEESVHHIIRKTKMEVLAVEGSKLEETLKLKESGIVLKAVISFDPPTGAQFEAFKEAGIALYHQENLRKKYLTIADNKTPAELEPSVDAVSTIIFTSGTTGLPKGAVHTNGSLLSFVGSYISSGNRLQVTPEDSTLSYLPLAHIYQRGVELVVTFLGLRVGYFSGDLLTLQEDLQLFKPSVFIAVPRVFSRIREKIESGLRQKSAFVQWVARKAMQVKLDRYEKDPTSVSALLPDLLFRKIRDTFGGNIRAVTVGSAPMDPLQLKELQMYLSAFIGEGWGMTEAGIAFLQDTVDGGKGTLGGPLASTEFKIVSVPDLNYHAKGRTPRGELLVRGPGLMREYFLDPEKTAEAFTEDGWLRTGDIVELVASGAVRIIDRRKNIFKLAHGEYVAPERLENIYSTSPWVQQIFVYGDSLEASLVAIIVPPSDAVRKWANENEKKGVPVETLLSDEGLKRQILTDLETLGRKQLKGFELIRGIYLTLNPFSAENGLATPTMKVIRSAARDRYKAEIETMYRQLKEQSRAKVG